MNVLLWIVQIVLALLSFSGGAYKIFAYKELAKMPATAALSHGGWVALGAFEIICAILLIVPAAMGRMRITAEAAAALMIESVALAIFYGRYSLSMTATNPLVWAVLTAVMAAFVAFGRAARH